MIQKVYNYIAKHNMIKAGDRVVAGISGGADSVCMLNILNELKQKMCFEILVVHIEHGIRGQESINDAKFVEDLCRGYGIRCIQFSYNVEKIAKDLKISTEEAGRKVRYDSFYSVMKEYDASKIAVAHNMDDNAETVLLNLIRGTGLGGLHGILPVRDKIIRPILCLSRLEIEKFLNERSIKYCIDFTNLTNDYTRNKIRNKILPEIKNEINIQVVKHIFNTADIIHETEDFIKKEVTKAEKRCVNVCNDKICISISKFNKEESLIKKELIKYVIKEAAGHIQNITAVHIDSVLELCNKDIGKRVYLPYDINAVRGYEYIEIGDKHSFIENEYDNVDIVVNTQGDIIIDKTKGIVLNCSIIENDKNFTINKKIYTKCLDYDKIKGTLKIRQRREKDTIIIDKLGKRQKLKKYFINEKIPKNDREKVLLLTDDVEIIWIIGHRISETYKVTNKTKKIMKLQMKGEPEYER